MKNSPLPDGRFYFQAIRNVCMSKENRNLDSMKLGGMIQDEADRLALIDKALHDLANALID